MFWTVNVLVQWTFKGRTEVSQVSLKTSLFVFQRLRKVIWVRNNMRVSRWWQNSHFSGELSSGNFCSNIWKMWLLEYQMLPWCVKALSGVTSNINYNTEGFGTSTGAMVEKTWKLSDQLYVWTSNSCHQELLCRQVITKPDAPDANSHTIRGVCL